MASREQENEEEIFHYLVRCEYVPFRARVGSDRHRFAVEFLDAEAGNQDMQYAIMTGWSLPRQGADSP
jgi:hypothetical protein